MRTHHALSLSAATLVLLLNACTGPNPRGAPVRGHRLAVGTGQMETVTDFGDNPGGLGMVEYVPVDLPAGAPLVVALHGCTQGAQDVVAAGWNDLADQWGFAVVYPEQTTDNNPMRCFNWAGEYGDPANLRRGEGENASIVAMVDHAIAEHGLDPSRVYCWGFSAGAAFASVLLATWPDVFAGGAILSGVPYGCATSVQGALDCQQLGQNPEMGKTPAEWGDVVRAAYPGYQGPYPRVTVWHGANDTFIVHHGNMVELAEQWTNVHGISSEPTGTADVLGHPYSHYDDGGVPVVETTLVTGMGHAVATSAGDPELPCGESGYAMYFEDHGICSTTRIARFFGLDPGGPGDPGQDPGDPGQQDGAPSVSITFPADGASVSGTVTITAQVVSAEAIDHVEFLIDGRSAALDRIAPYWFEWGAGEEAPGAHRIEAVALTASGASARDELTVQVGADGDGDGSAGTCGQSAGCAVVPRGAGVGHGTVLLTLGALGALARRRSRRL